MLNEIDLSRADLNLLVLFEAVMRERNVGRAAEKLSLTPSAVSHGLGRLRRLLNDPLFLRTPKGVVPTDRAIDLAEPVAEILAKVRSVVASAEPFDAATSTRRFSIGAPDAVSAVLIRALLAELERRAPGIDISVRQSLLHRTNRSYDRAWETILRDLERREIDVAVIPLENVPARFEARTSYEEEFVAVCRIGHPFAEEPTLDRFCAMRQLIVSQVGDPRGFVDEALAEVGRERRVALAVPNFMLAMALLAETDLIAALPRRLAAIYGERFGLMSLDLPVRTARNWIRVVAPKAALTDAGVAWLFETLWQTIRGATAARPSEGFRAVVNAG
jgi:DNA-binding transcriptional LysR family regulator